MKKFIFLSLLILFFALALVVLIFWFISMNTIAATSVKEVPKTQVTEDVEIVTILAAPEVISVSIPPGGALLSSWTLTDTQKETLSLKGIAVDTFVLDQTMLICAAKALGDAKITELFAGETIRDDEVAQLMPCIIFE